LLLLLQLLLLLLLQLLLLFVLIHGCYTAAAELLTLGQPHSVLKKIKSYRTNFLVNTCFFL
jgi:hypothetical protein